MHDEIEMFMKILGQHSENIFVLYNESYTGLSAPHKRKDWLPSYFKHIHELHENIFNLIVTDIYQLSMIIFCGIFV